MVMTELSVVVLCYHSGESILPIFDALKQLLHRMKLDYEIILVANDFADSKDQTIEIVKNIESKYNRVKAVTKIKEGMMGWDMLQGLEAATGQYICVIDGDGQFPLESIEKAYQIIIKEDVDMVKTYRAKREDGLYRNILSSVYNLIFKCMYPGLGSKDVNSKPKMIKRASLEAMNLESTDWFIDAEMMIQIRKLNMKYIEFPIVFRANLQRGSFVKINAIAEFILNLIRFRFK